MASKVKRITIPLPFEGMDLSTPAEALPPTRSDRVVNMLPHENFRMRQRGPIVWKATRTVRNSADGADLASGVYDFPLPLEADRIGIGAHVSPLAGNVAWRWQLYEPNAPTVIVDPTFGRGAAYVPSAGTLTTHDAANSAGSGNYSPHWTSFSGKVFTVGLVRGSTGASALYQTYQGKQFPRYEIWRHSGTALGWSNLPGDTEVGDSGPRGAMAICSYAGRLWVGGGCTPGTSFAQYAAATNTIRPNTLWYTEQNADPFVANFSGVYLNNWKRGGVSTGIINNVVVGQEDPTDAILQMVATDRYMLILKRNSTWVLTGSGVDTFQVRKVSDVGFVDPRGVKVRGSEVYWIAPEGLARYDGAEVTLVSGAIEPDWKAYNLTPMDECQITDLGDDYLMVALQTEVDNTITSETSGLHQYGSYLYHVPTGRWSYFDTALTTDSNFKNSVRHNGKTFFVDSAQVYQSGITRPDIGIGTSTKATDFTSASADIAFASGLRYPPVRLSATHDRAQLHRVGVNYRWMWVNNNASSALWSMFIFPYSWGGPEAAGAGQISPFSAFTFLNSRQAASVTDQRPQTAMLAIHDETGDFYISIVRDVVAAGGVDKGATAELRDAWVEVAADPSHRNVT